MPYSGVTAFKTITIQTMLDPKNAPNIKQYFVNDTDGDPTSIYYGQSALALSGKCLEQVLEYATVSGVKSIQKIGRRSANWGGTPWDIT